MKYSENLIFIVIMLLIFKQRSSDLKRYGIFFKFLYTVLHKSLKFLNSRLIKNGNKYIEMLNNTILKAINKGLIIKY